MRADALSQLARERGGAVGLGLDRALRRALRLAARAHRELAARAQGGAERARRGARGGQVGEEIGEPPVRLRRLRAEQPRHAVARRLSAAAAPVRSAAARRGRAAEREDLLLDRERVRRLRAKNLDVVRPLPDLGVGAARAQRVGLQLGARRAGRVRLREQRAQIAVRGALARLVSAREHEQALQRGRAPVGVRRVHRADSARQLAQRAERLCALGECSAAAREDGPQLGHLALELVADLRVRLRERGAAGEAGEAAGAREPGRPGRRARAVCGRRRPPPPRHVVGRAGGRARAREEGGRAGVRVAVRRARGGELLERAAEIAPTHLVCVARMGEGRGELAELGGRRLELAPPLAVEGGAEALEQLRPGDVTVAHLVVDREVVAQRDPPLAREAGDLVCDLLERRHVQDFRVSFSH